MSNPLRRLLEQQDVVIADGAMGTNLFALGLGKGDNGAAWNVERPDAVKSVHQGFVDAGSDILLTNTFGANRIRLSLHHLEHRAREFNFAGARLAREVADGAGRLVVVAGDIGPIGDVLEPLGTRSVKEAEDAFYEQAQALKDGGVDLAWIETMFADDELDAGARIIGGCCGTTPAHIRAIVAALASRPKGPPPSYDEIERRLGPLKMTTDAAEAA